MFNSLLLPNNSLNALLKDEVVSVLIVLLLPKQQHEVPVHRKSSLNSLLKDEKDSVLIILFLSKYWPKVPFVRRDSFLDSLACLSINNASF